MSLYRRTRVPYVPNRDLYLQHYRQTGGGNLPVFKGVYQDGSGLLGDIFRAALPMLRSSALSAGKTLLSSGAKALSDIVSGRNVKKAVTDRGLEGLKEIGRDVASRAVRAFGKSQRGGRQRRKPAERKAKTTKRTRDVFDTPSRLDNSTKRRRTDKTCVL